jgi:hypothetical protein
VPAEELIYLLAMLVGDSFDLSAPTGAGLCITGEARLPHRP